MNELENIIRQRSPPPPAGPFLTDPLLDSLVEMSERDKALVWKHRSSYLKKFPHALPKFLRSVPKTDRIAIQEMHKLLAEWAPGAPVDALEVRFGPLPLRPPTHPP